MALPIFQRTVTNSNGDIVNGAEVSVFAETTGLAAEIYSDRNGTVPLTNPFYTGSDGLAQFYAEQGEYRITATSVAGSVTWRYEPLIGTLDEGAAVLQAGIYAQDAAASAAEAETAATVAQSAANYQGLWSDATGAASAGWSYYYSGSIWMLLDDVADVSTTTPSSTNSDWFLVSDSDLDLPVKPTIRMNFSDNEYIYYKDDTDGFADASYSDIFTFARASDGSIINPIGGFGEVSSNVLRRTFDKTTGESLGALIEESRTRLNTVYIAPTTSENITVTAQAYTVSFYGTGTLTLSGAYTGTLVATGESDRVSLTFTPAAGTLTLDYSGAVENVQLEAGSFPTSIILGTEGTTVSRVQDHPFSVPVDEKINLSASTFYIDLGDSIPKGNNPFSFSLYLDGNNRFGLYHTGTQFSVFLVTGGVVQFIQPIGSDTGKFAISLTDTECNIASPTGDLYQASISDGLPSFSNIGIGSTYVNSFRYNGTIKYFAYFPRALDSETLSKMVRVGI